MKQVSTSHQPSPLPMNILPLTLYFLPDIF
jgi:hypothetical protein